MAGCCSSACPNCVFAQGGAQAITPAPPWVPLSGFALESMAASSRSSKTDESAWLW